MIASDKGKKRTVYYHTLEIAQATQPKDDQPFKKLIADYVKQWGFTYLEFLAPNADEEDENKGYYFFKKLKPYLTE